MMNDLLFKTKDFSDKCNLLKFDSFDGYIYNPLDYAWENHKEFMEKYIRKNPKALFLGMNPGPFGMMQTGVPFGEITAVLDYLKLKNKIEKPLKEHPARPVEGLEIKRSEISGLRFWGLAKSVYPNPEDFAKDFAVMNYCPLGFLSSVSTAKNITPDKLAKDERNALYNLCDEYIKFVIDYLNPHYLIGVGKFAREKLEKVNDSSKRIVTSIIHPSPGNPQANNGWQEKTIAKLKELDLWK